jgi:hypothetical protein
MAKITKEREVKTLSRPAGSRGPAQAATRSKFKALIRLLYAVSIISYVYFLTNGFSFYTAPYSERPHHEDYRQLRPAGMTGHTLGVIGSTFMIFMLSYSLRKRAKFLRNIGRLSHWLDIHIYFGIMGPLLIVLHTSFKVQGLVAVSFWSMVAVAASGIFGRYLYLQLPRNIQGDEVSAKELEDEIRRYTGRLRNELKLDESVISRLEKRDTFQIKEEDGAFKVLFLLLKEDALRPLRFKRRRQDYAELKGIPPRTRGEIIRISHKKALMTRRILLLNRVQQLFHYWHVIHKPFAIIMYTIMIIHIVVAVWTGYKWIF